MITFGFAQQRIGAIACLAVHTAPGVKHGSKTAGGQTVGGSSGSGELGGWGTGRDDQRQLPDAMARF
jgi:hypothetical protein